MRKSYKILIWTVVFLLLFILPMWFLKNRVASLFGSEPADIPYFQRTYLSIKLFLNKNTILDGYSKNPERIDFSIEHGESVDNIASRLKDLELISSIEIFKDYLILFGLDRNIQSGTFTIDPLMSIHQICQEISNPENSSQVFNILPGWRIEEIANSLALYGIKTNEFIDLAYNPSGLLTDTLNLPDNSGLEGFLYPGKYVLGKDMASSELISLFTEKFLQKVDSSITSAFKSNGLTLYQGITLASIIERETKIEEEKAKIASVFYNRLLIGMRLETDPTVQYALGFNPEWNSWWKSPLFLNDLAIDSPYNTYLYDGLPPGPISNPDISTILAAAYPVETPYYFFRAKCDGSGEHNFAVTYQEHLKFECDYLSD